MTIVRHEGCGGTLELFTEDGLCWESCRRCHLRQPVPRRTPNDGDRHNRHLHRKLYGKANLVGQAMAAPRP